MPNRRHPLLLCAALLLGSFLSPASAQLPSDPVPQGVFVYRLTLEQSQISIPFQSGGGIGFVNGTFDDLSVEGKLYPPGTPNPPQVQSKILLTAKADSDPGWVPGTPTPFSFNTLPGESVHFQVPIILGSGVQSPYFQVNLTASATDPYGTVHLLWVHILAVTPGIPNFGVMAQPPFPNKLAPRQVFTGTIQVRNLNFGPQSFEFKVVDNPCDMAVGLPSEVTIGGREGRDRGVQLFTVSFRAPGSSLYYIFGTGCSLSLNVNPVGQAGRVQTVIYNIQVQGPNFQFPFFFNTLVGAIVLVLVILFVRRRKQVIEEEILGKPQKPWTIPVEQVYLKHLKQKDERAWYVVRHHLMEDEYRSALLWYNGYKEATKGTRKKEALVLNHEHNYEKWRGKWEKAIAKPLKSANSYEAKLQRKLDRKARGRHRKALRAWRKESAKLKAVHQKQLERARERHAKDVKRAAKKGLPTPAMATVPQPDLAPEPRLERIPLAEHRFAKRSERYRRRMAKKQGNLEVQFERADALQQARLVKRVTKLARKLDDPEFIADHVGAGAARAK